MLDISTIPKKYSEYMKHRLDSRLPIFRTEAQAAILAEVFIYADDPLSLTDLAERVDRSLGTIHAEVERLERADLIRSRRLGRSRLVSANLESPYYPELRGLLLKAFGPAELLRKRLAAVEGVNRAFIYGSWATSEMGAATRQPRDIDVMVVGEPDLDDVHAAARDVEIEVGRPVNVTVLSPEEWASGGSAFLESVRLGPKVPVA